MANELIYLKNKVLHDEDITDYDIATYVALKKFYKLGMEEELITIPIILYQLYGRDFMKVDSTTKEKYREALRHLYELGVIDIREGITKEGRILYCFVDMYSLYFKASMYDKATTISKEELIKIMNIDSEEDNAKMLRYFITLIGTIDYKCKVGMISKERLAKESKITVEEALKFDEIFNENELIYYAQFVTHDEENNVSNKYDCHGRYEDRKEVREFAEL